MNEMEAFIEGWNARGRRDIQEIEQASSTWMENGPSKATAGFFVKLLKRITEPKPEER